MHTCVWNHTCQILNNAHFLHEETTAQLPDLSGSSRQVKTGAEGWEWVQGKELMGNWKCPGRQRQGWWRHSEEVNSTWWTKVRGVSAAAQATPVQTGNQRKGCAEQPWAMLDRVWVVWALTSKGTPEGACGYSVWNQHEVLDHSSPRGMGKDTRAGWKWDRFETRHLLQTYQLDAPSVCQ